MVRGRKVSLVHWELLEEFPGVVHVRRHVDVVQGFNLKFSDFGSDWNMELLLSVFDCLELPTLQGKRHVLTSMHKS